MWHLHLGTQRDSVFVQYMQWIMFKSTVIFRLDRTGVVCRILHICYPNFSQNALVPEMHGLQECTGSGMHGLQAIYDQLNSSMGND